MRTIEVDKCTKVIMLPEEYQVKRLVVTMPWVKQVWQGQNVQVYARHEDLGQKPYLPDGMLELKRFGEPAERFKVVEV